MAQGIALDLIVLLRNVTKKIVPHLSKKTGKIRNTP